MLHELSCRGNVVEKNCKNSVLGFLKVAVVAEVVLNVLEAMSAIWLSTLAMDTKISGEASWFAWRHKAKVHVCHPATRDLEDKSLLVQLTPVGMLSHHAAMWTC